MKQQKGFASVEFVAGVAVVGDVDFWLVDVSGEIASGVPMPPQLETTPPSLSRLHRAIRK